jgi:hypothetical protein
MTLRYILDPGGPNELTLAGGDIIQLDAVRTHTGLSDLSARVVENRDLDAFAKRQDRLNIEVDGAVKWTGYLIGTSHDTNRGTTTLRADGIAKRLKETRPDYDSLGGSLTYTNIALEDAIDDYWSRTPFSNYSVTPQSTEVIDQDATVQNADTNTEFTNITTLSNTEPFVIQNGQLELAQSGFFSEAEELSNGTEQLNNDASGGEEVLYSIGGDSFSFNLDYTIPESEVGWAMRYRNESGSTIAEISPQIDSTTVDTLPAGTLFEDQEFSWFQSNQWDSGDLTAGSHTGGFELGSDGDDIIIDCIFVYDQRFTYNFDDTVDSNQALSGPELYPLQRTTTFSEPTISFNITEANFELTIDDISNNQSLSLSFDSGLTYITANNTNTLTVQPSNPTRSVQGKVTLSRYSDGRTTTPTDGNAGQQIDVSTITADLNNLTVIDELELSRNHFENLQQLHEYGSNWPWTIEHDGGSISNMTVVSYQEGDETRSKPDSFTDVISEQAEVQAEAYFNSIYLQGALDSGGDRPVAEEKDNDAITNDGREISPGVLRDTKITTGAGARFRALSLLEKAQSNNDIVGEKTLASDTIVHPGYQYPVDFGEGDKNKTLEEVQLSESPNTVSLTARFTTPKTDLAGQIEQLQRRGRDTEDNV